MSTGRSPRQYKMPECNRYSAETVASTTKSIEKVIKLQNIPPTHSVEVMCGRSSTEAEIEPQEYRQHSSSTNSSAKHFSRMSENERKNRRRRQNNESSKRVRERRKLELEALQKAYLLNQERISQLENIVAELSSELRKRNYERQGGKQVPHSLQSNSMNSENNSQDERPGWFGSAF